MPYSFYFKYEHRVTVDADSMEEAIQKAMDVPLDYDMLFYTDEYDVEQWEEDGKEVE